MVLVLLSHSEDPEGVGDAVNMFIFIELSPSAGSDVDLLTIRLDVVLEGVTIASFANTGTLMDLQKVVPVAIWNASLNQMEAW